MMQFIHVFFDFRNLPDSFLGHAVGCEISRDLIPIGNLEDTLHVLIDSGDLLLAALMAHAANPQTIGIIICKSSLVTAGGHLQWHPSHYHTATFDIHPLPVQESCRGWR